jgi:hypothetical protein
MRGTRFLYPGYERADGSGALHATFDQTYGAFKTIVSEFSADEQRAIFFDKAKRTYRIDLECA